MPIDYGKYPPNWLSEIRPRIMKRSNGVCEFDGCDFMHMESLWSIKTKGHPTIWSRSNCWNLFSEEQKLRTKIKKVKVVLTVAHLDHDEVNHDVKDDRLKAACQLCHLRYDAKEKARRRLI